VGVDLTSQVVSTQGHCQEWEQSYTVLRGRAEGWPVLGRGIRRGTRSLNLSPWVMPVSAPGKEILAKMKEWILKAAMKEA
jgi:hypothetical protein